MFKRDSLRLGIILGFLAPIVGLVIYYLIQFRLYYSFTDFLKYIMQEKKLLTGITSICLIANAIVFTLYINSRRDRTARGVFIATVIYAIASLLWRLLK